MNGKKHTGRQTGKAITQALPSPAGGVRLQTFVPWTLVRRGLKKAVISPPGVEPSFDNDAGRPGAAPTEKEDSPLLRALGLAHHWQRLLDEERVKSVADIAKAEGMDVTQVRRVMRLTLLAPEVIERLVGAPDIVLEQVMRRVWSSRWMEQSRVLFLSASAD